jgi:succinate-semialdehyde dehydrogenase/glutarate-semialdehyde dehydrogenase
MDYEMINPTTNELIKTFPNYTDADVGAALSSVRALYKSGW